MTQTATNPRSWMMPCLCGGFAQIVQYLDGDDDVTMAKVRCKKCAAESHGKTQEDAVKRWHEKNP